MKYLLSLIFTFSLVFSQDDYSSWLNHKDISVSGYQVDISDYPLQLNIVRESSMSQDLSDLRFSDNDGNSLSYFIESSGDSWINAWVRLGVVSSDSYVIRLYYGNDTAQSESNPQNVFDIYEDFENSGWDTSSDWIINQQNGAGYQFDGDFLSIDVGTTDNFISIDSNETFDLSNSYSISWRIKAETDRGHFFTGIADGNNKSRTDQGGYNYGEGFGLRCNHEEQFFVSSSNGLSEVEIVSNDEQFQNIEMVRHSNGLIEVFVNNETVLSEFYESNATSNSLPFYFWANGWDNGNRTVWIDDLTVRKVIPNEGLIVEWIENIEGCTDEAAENYNPYANLADGSCEYSGDCGLYFDGEDDYISSDDFQTSSSQNSVYFSFSTTDDSTDSDGDLNVIFSTYEGDSPSHIEIGTRGGYLGYWVRNSNDESFYGDQLCNIFVADGQRHDFGMNIDHQNDRIRIHIDDQVCDYDGVNSTGYLEISNTLNIGRQSQSHGNYFNGKISDVVFWATDVNFNELGYDYLNYSGTNNYGGTYSEQYRMQWRFDECNGDIVYDLSEHGGPSVEGNINGATWFMNIQGCTDEYACNYDEEANTDDGSCDYEDLCGECGGNNSSCEIITDIDGNEYGSVTIGNQVWMKQNLKTANYNNGDAIPTDYNADDWDNLSEGAYSTYDDNDLNKDIYGNLYNWWAANDDRGVCPVGWELPSESDWSSLVSYLGGQDVAGGKLKQQGLNYWNAPNGGATNESGFSALPAGTRHSNGGLDYEYIGDMSNFWSTGTTSEANGLNYLLNNDSGYINITGNGKGWGGSIRCLKENIEGCTDQYACNYNEEANIDDGSCDYACHDNGDNGLIFDGQDDYIKVEKSLDINNYYTINAWVKRESNDYNAIFWYGDEQGSWIEIYTQGQGVNGGSDDGKLTIAHNRGLDNSSNTVFNYFTPFPVGEWVFLSVIYGGSVQTENVNVYYNGVHQGGATIPLNNLPETESFLIGKMSPVWGDTYLEGNIDYFDIWNISLNPDEIISVMNDNDLDNDLTDIGLIARYKINQGNEGLFPNILIDDSGNGNHGTISGATWFDNNTILGCMDPLAENYNEEATLDDNSCTGGPINHSSFTFAGEFDNGYYYISKNESYANDAIQECEYSNGNLVSISSQQENDFVSSLVPGVQFWIGLTDEGSEGNFEWVDGSVYDYQNWAPTEPSNSGPNGNEDHTLINAPEGWSDPFDGFWNDVDGNHEPYLFVLEYREVEGCTYEYALNYNPNASDDDGNCIFYDSCQSLFVDNSDINSGNYFLQNDDGSYETHCMKYGTDVYTLTSRITNSGTNWQIADHYSEGDDNNWENDNLFGDLNDLQSDYKGQAYIDVSGKSVLISYNGINQNNILLKTNNDCLEDSSLKEHFNSLSWDCGYDLEQTLVGESCAHPCFIESYETSDQILNPNGESEYLYFQAGEQVGIDEQNNDRAYISGSAYRTNINYPSGLGSSCNGSSGCSGNEGSVNIGVNLDGVSSPSGEMSYSVYVGGSILPTGCTDEYACNYDIDAGSDDDSCYYDCHDNGDYSLSFDMQDDYVFVDKEVLSDSFTISAWIFPNFMDDSHRAVYADYSDLLEIWFGYGFEGKLRLHVGGLDYLDSETNVIEYDSWNHIVAVWDGSEAKIYSNGNLVASGSNGLGNPEPHTFNLGARMNNNSNYHSGYLNKIDLFNHALSQEEIQYLNNPNHIDSSSSASYRFNQGLDGDYPNTLIDHSGNRHHGAINGATWIESIVGCTDPLACNFIDEAISDDGSCDYDCHDNGDHSLIFDGGQDDYVQVDGALISNFPFTLSADILINDLQVNNIIAKLSPNYIWYIRNADGTQLSIYNEGVGDFGNAFDSFQENIWYNIVISVDENGNITQYVNGNELDVVPGSFEGDVIPENIAIEDLTIGSFQQDNETFNGKMKSFKIWNKVLNQEEVFQNLNGQYQVDDLVTDWKINQGDEGDYPGTLIDHSGNRNHGTIYGATWIENIPGCTDPLAGNYNEEALIEDGTCEYSEAEISISDLNFDILVYENLVMTESFSISNNGLANLDWGILNSPDWLDILVTSGTIESGTSELISLEANSYGYECGDYSGLIEIITDDPNNLSITIPVSMNILYPVPVLSQSSLDFGDIGFESESTIDFIVENQGCSDLDFSGAFESQYFVIDSEETMTVAPGASIALPIIFTAGIDEIELLDNLILTYQNDPFNISDVVSVSASVIPDSHPIITSIVDVPEDQGGWVNLTFTRSIHDTDSLSRVESYSVEADYGNGWIISGSGNAYSNNRYTMQVHTQIDSSSTSDGLVDFRVIAGMEEGNFASSIAQGYSVDNIDPSTPEDVYSSSISGDNNVSIEWNYNPDFDFSYHQITGLNTVEHTIGNQVDIPLLASYDEYYVSSFDINGNSSAPSTYSSAYNLHYGANLVSFSVVPDDNSIGNLVECPGDVQSIIGQGQAATCLPFGWAGSLDNIEASEGYWLVTSESGEIITVDGNKNYNTDYDLNYGANLISYTCNLDGSLEDLISGEYSQSVLGIIGEGDAATILPNGQWVGSLDSFEPGKGYWIKVSEAMELNYDCPSESLDILSRYQEPEEIKNYVQSTKQAFYFFEDIENIEVGDRIESYCNNVLVGSRVWTGAYMDVPLMGQDDQDITDNYCVEGSIPTFRLIKDYTGEVFGLVGDIPSWTNNQIFMLDNMITESLSPETYSLSKAYPNPFNPSTTISFSVPSESFISVELYDITGRNIHTLASDNYQPGYYSVSWDASEYSSGVYFVKMISENYIESQKIMLIK